ncbi:vitelline membrane outer layer protein 1 homolog [Anomalospiza imberbis]|uniref:vitelline membrane outer layer protein 1 homolog n=1 Tax=Anomalospiza imberbis TaxID=187417 RepID=UPI00358FBF71
MVEAARGPWDDTAANNMAVLCSEGIFRRQAGGLDRGDWGAWSHRCDASCGVCGIRTRVDAGHPSDGSGLNDVKLFCCTS